MKIDQQDYTRFLAGEAVRIFVGMGEGTASAPPRFPEDYFTMPEIVGETDGNRVTFTKPLSPVQSPVLV